MGVTAATVTSTSTSVRAPHSKRKCEDDLEEFDPARLTHEDREAKIVETLARLKALIDERKPSMISNYNAECERVQEERKKIQIASAAEGAPHVEKRLPKRRFPWCARSRSLLARLTRLAASPDDAVLLLAKRALPLFPNGFVRMPTLLRQADLSKEIKVSDMKRQRIGSTSQMTSQHTVQFTEPVFPSSLTVTTTLKPSQEKNEVAVGTEEKPYKTNSVFGSIMNSFSLSKDLIIEKPDKKDNDKVKEDVYIPPNNIGSITITPVPNNLSKPEKKLDNNVQAPEKQSGFIRVKSPAALNEMVKKDKIKKLEKNVVKEKRVASPLHIDTNYQQNKKEPSPKSKEEIPQKHIDSMRVSENNIPRPGLIPVHHSPTFAKPDRRPPEVKKKKEILIVSDLDPLAADPQEPLAVDDSSSDVEVIEDNRTDKSEPKRDKCEIVPSKESVIVENNTKVNSVKCKSGKEKENHKSERDDATNEDINNLMKNIQEMAHSQEPTKFKNNAYAGVITSAIHEKSSSQYRRSVACGDTRADKDKL